jgi:hypothetical protein
LEDFVEKEHSWGPLYTWRLRQNLYDSQVITSNIFNNKFVDYEKKYEIYKSIIIVLMTNKPI